MDGDSGFWVGVGAAIGTIIGAVAAAVVAIINGRAKANAVAEQTKSQVEDALAVRWQNLVAIYEKRIALLEANGEQSARALQASNEAHTRRLVQYESLWGWAVRMRDYCLRLAAALKQFGVPDGDVPDLPHRDDDPDAERAAAEFKLRTVLHDTATLKRLDQKSQPPELHP